MRLDDLRPSLRFYLINQAIRGRPIGVIAKEYELDIAELRSAVSERSPLPETPDVPAPRRKAGNSLFEARVWMSLETLRRVSAAAKAREDTVEGILEDIVSVIAGEGLFDAVLDDGESA